ncbi:hypothetical protein [Fodinicurvata sp. EGI_FJ10296]|uniref:hypothetical protein n=1 Tax=Fodinicurvata sp. EGI_FJ10296 TaxID=3231908 RepID=UPI0034554B92
MPAPHLTTTPADFLLAPESPWRGTPVEREIRRAVAYNMIRCRQKRGWSMRKISIWLNSTPERVAALELGHETASAAELFCLAGLFDVTLERMVMPTASPPAPSAEFLAAPNPVPDPEHEELIFDDPTLPDLRQLLESRGR